MYSIRFINKFGLLSCGHCSKIYTIPLFFCMNLAFTWVPKKQLLFQCLCDLILLTYPQMFSESTFLKKNVHLFSLEPKTNKWYIFVYSLLNNVSNYGYRRMQTISTLPTKIHWKLKLRHITFLDLHLYLIYVIELCVHSYIENYEQCYICTK